MTYGNLRLQILCSVPKASINTSMRLHFCSSGTKITFHVWGLKVEVLGGRKTLLIYVPNLKCLIVISVKIKKHRLDMCLDLKDVVWLLFKQV